MSYSSSEVATDSDVSHSPSTDELPIAAESIHRPTALPGHADTTESAEERLRDAIQSVEDAIAPVWPLKDYVAVNPFLGLSDRPFLNARRLLRSISDCEILMPIEFYQARFRQGAFGCVDVEDAVDEVSANSGIASVGSASLNAEHVFEALSARSFDELPTTKNSERHLRTISETVDLYGSSNWTEAIREEIGELCAAHYDDGEAAWSNPWRHLPLYQAWQSAARLDRRVESLGLKSFRKFVDGLPPTPQATIAYALRQLNVPEQMWESFLLCQAQTIPGWSSWAKYQVNQTTCEDGQDFIALLAIRLAYEVVLARQTRIRIDWNSVSKVWKSANGFGKANAETDALIRFTLLRASEIAYERTLLASLDSSLADNFVGAEKDEQTAEPQQCLAQVVFCIDVRSERIRRSLEQSASNVQTFGFAGFFGVPIAWQTMGEDAASPQVPALLSPSFTVSETIRDASDAVVENAGERRSFRRTLRKAWKQFQASAVGCFGFVETSGIAFGWKLFSKSVTTSSNKAGFRFDGVQSTDQAKLSPDLSRLEQQGISVDQQVDMAASILKGIGIVDDFAKLVVFCGHASTTQNNPLQAGLDCGACCGHSGEPNARFAAALLNQPHVRTGLADHGIVVPEETQFVAAVHDTTTDGIGFFDTDLLSDSQRQHLLELQAMTKDATELCQLERMPHLAANSISAVMQRSADWSEVRPEWGLAGNAAFVVAPREVTQSANLDGRSFLHSYNWRNDTDFKVLEQIMTAPMVVAHWINMQYYASSVDNKHYGSGSKTIHNVVGKFGIFSGNGGDLTTGLPWQSLHNGTDFQHEPLRLLSVIAAPRDAVAGIVQQHKVVEDLLTNGWLNLVVLDEGGWYRFSKDSTWVPVNGVFSPQEHHCEAVVS